MRPHWKGYLKLALVSCPIALHAACSSAERIALRQINKATGNRLRQQLVDEETGAPVGPEHKARGYEVAKDRYLIVEDAELEAIEIESTRTIEIDSFVPRAAIDQRFFDSPYYVMPSEPVGQEAFAVIREAMRGKPLRVDERLAERVDVDLLFAQYHHPAGARLALAVPGLAVGAELRRRVVTAISPGGEGGALWREAAFRAYIVYRANACKRWKCENAPQRATWSWLQAQP
jgi:Ku70/Ku80 beta-barrel domain